MMTDTKGSGLFGRPSRVLLFTTEDQDVSKLVTVLNRRKENTSFSNCLITFTDDAHVNILDTTQTKTMKEWARFQDSLVEQDFVYQVLSTARNILFFENCQSLDPALANKNITPYLNRINNKAVLLAKSLAEKITNSSYYRNQNDVLKFLRNLDAYTLDMALHFRLPDKQSKAKRMLDLQNIQAIFLKRIQEPANTPSCDLERSLATGNISICHLASSIYQGKEVKDLLAQKLELKKIVKCLCLLGEFEIKSADDKLFEDPSLPISSLVKYLSVTYPQLCSLFLLTSQNIPTLMGADLQTIFNSSSAFPFAEMPNTRIMIASLPDKKIHVEFTVNFVRPEDPLLKITGKAEVYFNPQTRAISVPAILSYEATHKLSTRQQQAQYIIEQAFNKEKSHAILDLSAKSSAVNEEPILCSAQEKAARKSIQLDRNRRITHDKEHALVSPRIAAALPEGEISPRIGEPSPVSTVEGEEMVRLSRRRSTKYEGGRISLSNSQYVAEMLKESAEVQVQAATPSAVTPSSRPVLQRSVSAPYPPPKRSLLSKALSLVRGEGTKGT